MPKQSTSARKAKRTPSNSVSPRSSNIDIKDYVTITSESLSIKQSSDAATESDVTESAVEKQKVKEELCKTNS